MTAEITKLTSKNKASKREKFVRLAQSRTANAMKAIRIIAKLGNKSHYEYDERDVRKIVAALNKEVEALRSRMLSSGGKDLVEFNLD
ncbi:MAG: hypothetical protein ACK4NP_14585 [Parvularculaceae bacterium]